MMSLSTDLSAIVPTSLAELGQARRVGTAAEGGSASGGKLLLRVMALGIGLSIFAPAPAAAATLSTNAAWAWIKGANITNQTGTYGTPGVPAPANTPGARAYAVSWKDAAGALWLFSGSGYAASGGLGSLNDLWKYDLATTNWAWIKGANITNQNGTYGTQGVPAPANMPGARYLAVSWTNVDGVLWLFGGEGYASSGGLGYLNDLWKYDPGTTNWTWMKGSTNINQLGTYGTQGVPAAINTPGARERAATWTDGTGALWLFGGYGYPTSGVDGSLNDLWKFDPATTNWTWMKGTTTIDQNGAYGTQGVPVPTNTPGARYSAVSWTDGVGALWLFGGSGYAASGLEGYLNDLWKYDPGTTNWTWIKGANITNQLGTYGTQGVPAPANMPGARYLAVLWTDGVGALWLFGGYGYPASGAFGSLNDLWKYDPGTTNWTWMKGTNIRNQIGNYGPQGVPAPANMPGARYSAVSWTDGVGALWLFGGSGYPASGGAGYLNDLWKFDVGGGISLDTNALVFSATFQGANPAAQMIGLTNVGGTAFNYTNVITYSAGASGWLTVLPAAGAVALNGATTMTNQVNIAGLGAGTYYATNQVTADATNSPQSVVVTLTVNALNTPPSAPTGVFASDGTYTNKVRVTWNASSGATSYEVWRYTSESSNSASKISSPNPTGTNYDDTSTTVGTTYYYWLKAVNGAGASSFSASDSGFLGVVGPLITANGLVGDVYFNSGVPVTIAVQMMNIEPHLGVEVDWWVVAFAHSEGWFYLDSTPQWQAALFSGDYKVFHPVYQGPLDNLSSTPVLSGFPLPSGTYDFWFAVDYPLDGILNLNGPILYDNVTVFVQ